MILIDKCLVLVTWRSMIYLSKPRSNVKKFLKLLDFWHLKVKQFQKVKQFPPILNWWELFDWCGYIQGNGNYRLPTYPLVFEFCSCYCINADRTLNYVRNDRMYFNFVIKMAKNAIIGVLNLLSNVIRSAKTFHGAWTFENSNFI